MGNSVFESPAAITSVSFDHTTSNPHFKYQLEEYRNFKHATYDQKYFLVTQIYPCFTSLFSSLEDFSVLIQELFYSPTAISSTLFIFRSKVTQQIAGFSFVNYFQVYLLPNDITEKNKYIIVNGFGCVQKETRGEGLTKNFFIYKNKSDIEYFKNQNILIVDVCINPLSYYGSCQTSKIIFPKYNEKTPQAIENVFLKVMEIVEYESLGEDNKFLVKDCFTANENLLEKFRGNQDRFPEDIKYFNRVTGLREYVGLGFVSIVNLVEGNTLEFTPGDYSVERVDVFDEKKVDFDKPKI